MSEIKLPFLVPSLWTKPKYTTLIQNLKLRALYKSTASLDFSSRIDYPSYGYSSRWKSQCSNQRNTPCTLQTCTFTTWNSSISTYPSNYFNFISILSPQEKRWIRTLRKQNNNINKTGPAKSEKTTLLNESWITNPQIMNSSFENAKNKKQLAPGSIDPDAMNELFKDKLSLNVDKYSHIKSKVKKKKKY